MLLGYGQAGRIGWLRGALFLLSLAYGLPPVRRRRKHRFTKRQNLYWRRYLAGLCPRCEYNLAGLPEPRCPECGTRFDNVLQQKWEDGRHNAESQERQNATTDRGQERSAGRTLRDDAGR